MIKNLNGIYEKVDFNTSSTVLYVNSETEDYPVHWHTSIEIIMPLENIYTVKVNKTSYHLEQDDIFIIPPGELHELYAPPSGRRIIFQFDYSLVRNFMGFQDVFTVPLQPCLIKASDIEANIQAELKSLLLNIRDEYSNNNSLREASINSKIIQMFILIARQRLDTQNIFPDVKSSKQLEYIDKFYTILDYINNNYTENITLDKISEFAGFSKFHFSRLFKQFTDLSFYDYLNQKRVKVAEELLLNPNLSITDIAMQSGFNSLSTFNRVFKQFKECTPTEFKNLNYNSKKSKINRKRRLQQ